ncbi:Cullin-associated NEDD8-dissociated protein 1 [Thoreauomyces humboldtii]|nr:Cullin-associated NEDD8-dissociated protein 1 [Thoreauomyces humboldtii]
MSHHDSDYRWMATNDLMAALQSDTFHLEDVNEKKVVAALIKLLTDSNGEVQNVAVKWCAARDLAGVSVRPTAIVDTSVFASSFAPLVKKIHESQLQEVLNQLCKLLTDNREEMRDIAGIGLKTVVTEIPSDSFITSKVVGDLVPKLLQQFQKNDKNPQLDVIDILSEVLSRFGQSLAQGSDGPALQKAINDALFPLLNHSRASARKRATGAIGHLVSNLPDDLFDDLVENILSELTQRTGSSDYDKLRTYIGCLATLSRHNAHRFGQHLDKALPLVFELVQSSDDELRENCLHALDSFVLRCPTEMTPYIAKVTAMSLTYIKHDPNFQYEEDDEPMEADTEGDDGEEEDAEEEEYEEDYSDEDDVSWKVRKASSKLLASIIGTRSDVLQDLLNMVAPVLIERFKEREESVRVDILNTFEVLVRQTGVAAGVEKIADPVSVVPGPKRRKGAVAHDEPSSPRELLRQLVPRLSKALAKELKGKSILTRQAGFGLLREVVRVLNGGLDAQLGLFIPSIELSLSNLNAGHLTKASTNSNLKIEILEFLRLLFTTHEPELFHRYLSKLIPPIMSAAEDKFYKITSEALAVTVELVKIIRPIPYDEESKQYAVQPLASPQFREYLQSIYDTTLKRLKAADVDLEVKEHSIVALSGLISQAGDLLPSDQITTVVIPLLIERLKNELTRLTTVRVLKSIADSPLFENQASTGAIDLTPILPEAMSELTSYLRKSHRQLRVASLQCLETLIRRYGKHLASGTFSSILSEVRPLLNDPDLHILPLAMAVICIVVYSGPSAEVLPIIKGDVQPQLVKMILDSPHLVASGTGLDALLKVWQAIVRTGEAQLFSQSVDMLIAPVSSASGIASSKQAFAVIAQSLATICLNYPGDASPTITNFMAEIEKKDASESMCYVSLLTLGDIGRSMDLSAKHPNVDQTVLALFASSSEEIKQAAAFALGNIALGNLKRFMPVVLQTVREGGKRRYLVLVSLKEIITRFSHHEASTESTAILESFAPELWQLLFQNTEETAEEATRNAIAECLGKLSLSQPEKFLPDLRSRLSSPNAHARATVVTAIRYTFTEHTQHDDFDTLLRPLILDFLRLVKDSDLNVRRVSLTTLNSAAHNKPHLILGSLNELLPLLYDETVVKTELIHIVEMGPFKHQVDDGLDTRKAAFECMYTLLETCLSRIDVFGFLQRVMNGLRDPSNDIKILSHLMLQRLSQLSPTAVAQKLDDLVEPLKLTLLAKSKSNAVKQEVEKTNELVRSTARTTLVLQKISEVGVSPRFVEYLKEVQGPQSAVQDIMAAEAQNGLLSVSVGGVMPMDLS